MLLCLLALLLIRVAERRTGLTWRRIEIEPGRLHAVTLSGTAGTAVQTTPMTEFQAGILRTCQVALRPASPLCIPPDLRQQAQQAARDA